MRVTYVARDSLVPGHVAGQQYTMVFAITAADPSTARLAEKAESLDGHVETLDHGRVRTWSITLLPLPNLECDIVREFLDSTGDGQLFTIDLFGTEENVRDPKSVVREDSGQSERRVVSTDDATHDDMFEFSFSVREQ